MDINFQLFDPCYGDSASLPNKPCIFLIVLRAGCSMPYYNNVVPKFSTYEFSGEKLKVLFVGKSKNGLRSRDYNQHFNANTSRFSMLRKSIGILLGYKFAHGDSLRYFGDKDEKRITEWMENNMLLFYSSDTGDIDAAEKELIEVYNPPLNIKGNKNEDNKDFRKNLSEQLNPRKKKENNDEQDGGTDADGMSTPQRRKIKARLDSNGMIVCPKCDTHLLVSPDIADDEQIQCSDCGAIFDNPLIPIKKKRERLERQREKEERENDPTRRFFRHLFYAILTLVVMGFGYAAIMKCDTGSIKVDGTTRYIITQDYMASSNEEAAILREKQMSDIARGDYNSVEINLNVDQTPVHLFQGDVVVVIDVNHKYGYKVRRLSDFQEAIVDSPKYLKKLE